MDHQAIGSREESRPSTVIPGKYESLPNLVFYIRSDVIDKPATLPAASGSKAALRAEEWHDFQTPI